MRRFVVVGQRASASPDFSLTDLAGSTGRLDVLLRCLRAGLLVSNGVRRDTIVYLVLAGGRGGPTSLRFDGATARFLRPDERSLATLVQKVLRAAVPQVAFSEIRPGVAVAAGGFESVVADLAPGTSYIVEEDAADIRAVAIDAESPVFFVGDQLGFDATTRARILANGATPVGLGPVSVHAEDAVTVVCNELDRRSTR